VETLRWGDDDQLMAALGEAVRLGDPPPEFVAAGRAAYAWRTIDAELAALTYDSAAELCTTATRAQAAPVRALTFAAADVTIEVELTGDALLGQVCPARDGTVDVERSPDAGAGPADGGRAGAPVAVDEVGYFVVRPLPAGPFRLRYRRPGGVEVVTGWITP